MSEFLTCQRWLADDPERNWKLWMDDDHAARDVWRARLRKHTPALHDGAVEALTPEQRKEGEVSPLRANGSRKSSVRRGPMTAVASSELLRLDSLPFTRALPLLSSATHPTMPSVCSWRRTRGASYFVLSPRRSS